MATKAFGTLLKIANNSIAGLTSIGGLKISRDTKEVTTLSSSEDGYKEYIALLKDGGEVSVSGYFIPSDSTGQYAMFTALSSDTATAFSIIFPSSLGAEWDFNGLVTGFETSAEVNDVIPFTATIKVTGKPTLGLTTSTGLSALSLTGTGGTLSPSFANGTYYYSFGGISAASITVTATAASHTLKLYVDGTYSQDLTSGSASTAITMSIGSKKLTILATESAKTTKVYEIVAIKTS